MHFSQTLPFLPYPRYIVKAETAVREGMHTQVGPGIFIVERDFPRKGVDLMRLVLLWDSIRDARNG